MRLHGYAKFSQGNTSENTLEGVQTGVGVELKGMAGNDILYGNYSNNDTLDGGTGRDRMFGFGGNDTYYIDDAGDSIEVETAGTHTIKGYLFYYNMMYVATNVENVDLIANAD